MGLHKHLGSHLPMEEQEPMHTAFVDAEGEEECHDSDPHCPGLADAESICRRITGSMYFTMAVTVAIVTCGLTAALRYAAYVSR